MERLAELARQCGFSNTKCLRTAVSGQWGIKRASVQPDIQPVEEPDLVINLPEVKLRDYKTPRRKKGDEETAVLVSTDGHACKVTVSYNIDVYRERMWKMFNNTMLLVNLHRQMYPIRNLVILNLGDNTQGENPHQGSMLGGVESNYDMKGARDQTTKIATPMWNNLLGSFAQEFVSVDFHGIPGNHGHDKLAPETSREDIRLYDMLEAGIGQNPKINIHVHELWYAMVDIYGFKCFCFHGDGVPIYNGIPFFAMDRRLKSWHMQFGGFNYAFSGHYHHSFSREIAAGIEHIGVGTMVSDDDWSIKKLGVSSSPRQFLCGFHPRHGMTWRYQLDVR